MKSQRQHQRSSGYEDFGNGAEYSDFFESMFGGNFSDGNRSRNVKFRGQDFNAQLHLNLRDVYTTQKQVLTVNGKNIRLICNIPQTVLALRGSHGVGIEAAMVGP